MMNKTTPAVVAGMDTIARRIIGPENIEKLEQLDELYIQQLRDQCHRDQLSPRSSRRLPGQWFRDEIGVIFLIFILDHPSKHFVVVITNYCRTRICDFKDFSIFMVSYCLEILACTRFIQIEN